MRAIIFSTRSYERAFLAQEAERAGHVLELLEVRLTKETASLTKGFPTVAIFANDDASAPILRILYENGVRLLTLRSAGFNHVDLEEADRLGLVVVRVPAYSPYAVAEHAVGLMLALNRKIHRAYQRVREQNFSLDGLIGFDMHGKTVGVIGTGKIGEVVCRILTGFGSKVLAFDPVQNPSCLALGVQYVSKHEVLVQSDILSLHCPLTPETRHFISAAELSLTKKGVMIINTSRGGMIDTKALIVGLKSSHIGSVGLDVYEEEADLFFNDLSQDVIHDDVFVRLMTFPNVLITAHQGFLTREAVSAIERITIENISSFEQGNIIEANRVTRSLLTTK